MGEILSQFMTQPSNILSHLKHEIKGFLKHVQAFYIEACLQIKQHFPINDEILKSYYLFSIITGSNCSGFKVSEQRPGI